MASSSEALRDEIKKLEKALATTQKELGDPAIRVCAIIDFFGCRAFAKRARLSLIGLARAQSLDVCAEWVDTDVACTLAKL